MYNVVCGYGISHLVTNGNFFCNCEKRYGFMAVSFKKYMCKKGKIYESDYTEEDRLEYKKIYEEKQNKFRLGISSMVEDETNKRTETA